MRKTGFLARFSHFLWVAIALISLLSVPVYAGDGDGSGGGSGEPLVLSSSSVPDGSVNVETDAVVTLTFSKNVVNIAVRDNNLGCFSLRDADGNAVSISVQMGDDQVDPTIKRIVQIVPASLLAPGTSYTLTISGNLTSKSGESLGQDLTVAFTTALAAVAEPTAPAAAPAETVPIMPTEPTAAEETAGESEEPAIPSTPAESVETVPSPKQTAVTSEVAVGNAEEGPEESGGKASVIIPVVAAAAVVCSVPAIVITRKKRKK